MAEEVEVSEEVLDAARAEALAEREKRVDAALRGGKLVDAVTAALENPPFGSKNTGLKDRNAAVVMKALRALGAKEDQLPTVLDALTPDAADACMKYVYRGLAKPDDSGLLLKLHEALVTKAGLGCIVRAITDRKTA